jgi:hypothetical protein
MIDIPHIANEQKGLLTVKDFYDQGSRACQQYSQLTMQVRTLAQQVMIAYAVGLGLFIARSESLTTGYLRVVLCGAGIILLVFGLVLFFLNLHHSLAFRAIRDECLVPLEKYNCIRAASEEHLLGPWQAHQQERSTNRRKSDLAWYSPFVALWLIGAASLAIGLWLLK